MLSHKQRERSLPVLDSDIGWVVGHSYIVYGPLLHGATTVLYEGKPVHTPDVCVYIRLKD